MVPGRTKNAFYKALAATAIYAALAFYLYRPYLKHLGMLEYLLLVNPVLAAVGTLLLGRRWINGFWESFFAGLLYGFGPFMLGLARYHPTAGFTAAAVPWLFLPAAAVRGKDRRWLSRLLILLPFLVIISFFQLSAHFRLFAVPIQSRLRFTNLAGLLAPLVAVKRDLNPVGFYHIPIAAMVIGLAMVLKARRLGVLVIFAAGLTLASCGSFLQSSPIMWLSVPVLFCSVLAGEGMQGLIRAGAADKGWVLMASLVMASLAVASLLLATRYLQGFFALAAPYGRLFVRAGQMYILGALATAIIFFLARMKIRVSWLRLIILGSAMAVDVFSGATFIVDQSF